MNTTIAVNFVSELDSVSKFGAVYRINKSLHDSLGAIYGEFKIEVSKKEESDQTGTISDSKIEELKKEMEKLNKRDEVWEIRYRRALEFLHKMV